MQRERHARGGVQHVSRSAGGPCRVPFGGPRILIPLDVAEQVKLTLDIIEQLPAESSRAGRLLRHLIPFAFRSYRQHLGLESIFLQDVVALTAALHPELFEMEEMSGTWRPAAN